MAIDVKGLKKGWDKFKGQVTGSTARRHKEQKTEGRLDDAKAGARGVKAPKVGQSIKQAAKKGLAVDKELKSKAGKVGGAYDKIVNKKLGRADQIIQGYKKQGSAASDVKDMEAVKIDPKDLPQLEAGKVGPMTAVQANRADVANVAAGTVQGMQAGQIDRSRIGNVQAGQLGTSDFRGTQVDLAASLQAQAAGTAPSIAEMQAKRQGDRALAQQLAMQAGATGSQAALARRQAARGQAQISADIAATSAQTRLAEQRQAQEQLAQVSSQARQQDVTAGIAQQEADLKAQMQNQGVDLDVFKTNLETESRAALANLNARQADRDAKLRADLANQGVDLDILKQNAAAGNAAALANLKNETANMDRELKAAMGNQAATLDILKQNAAAGNAAAASNLQAALTKAGMDDAMQTAYMQNEVGLSMKQIDILEGRKAGAIDLHKGLYEAKQRRIMGLEGMKQAGEQAVYGQRMATERQIVGGEYGKAAADSAAAAQQQAGGLGGLATLGAAYFSSGGGGEVAAAASDINLKKNIKKKDIGTELTGDRLTDFLEKLDAYDYDYKDEKYGEGRQTSVMAQDLEASEIGKKAVIETPEGKMVNYGKLLPEMLAATAQTHKRINKLEEALLKKKKNSKK